jgi:hypothetical protein
LGLAIIRRRWRERRIRVVDGLQRIRRVFVPLFIHSHLAGVPRHLGRRCQSQEKTPVLVDVGDTNRAFRFFMGFAQERGHNPTFAPMAIVVAPFQG